jgi:hypothetical protein
MFSLFDRIDFFYITMIQMVALIITLIHVTEWYSEDMRRDDVHSCGRGGVFVSIIWTVAY